MYLNLLLKLRHCVLCSRGRGCQVLVVAFPVRVAAQAVFVGTASFEGFKLLGEHLIGRDKMLLHDSQVAFSVLCLFHR